MKIKTPKIPVSWGELIDKITILEIKREKIKDSEKLKNINVELDLLKKSDEQLLLNEHTLTELKKELAGINLRLWDIEDQIRLKEKEKEFDSHFIDLARSVYFENDERAKIKRKINLQMESEIVEEKSYARY